MARDEHLEQLLALCESELERSFLRFLDRNRLRLPSAAQRRVEAANARPDFVSTRHMLVYVNGPVHDFADRLQRDRGQQTELEDRDSPRIALPPRRRLASGRAALP